MTTKEEDMLAQAIGRMFLQYGNSLDMDALAKQVKSDAVQCLLDIAAILSREELDDFSCVEEIVLRLEKEGLGTFRHDFG